MSVFIEFLDRLLTMFPLKALDLNVLVRLL